MKCDLWTAGIRFARVKEYKLYDESGYSHCREKSSEVVNLVKL